MKNTNVISAENISSIAALSKLTKRYILVLLFFQILLIKEKSFSGRYPFECSICKKGYGDKRVKRELNKHMDRHAKGLVKESGVSGSIRYLLMIYKLKYEFCN